MAWGGGEYVFARTAANTKHLYTMTYANGTFGAPVLLPFSNTTFDDESPRFAPDDLTLYFGSTRGGASLDIYAVRRATVTSPWGPPAPVAGPNTAGTDKWYAPCDGDHYLVVSTGAAGDTDLFEGIVGAAPALVTALSSAANDTSAFLTRDCLTAYFASARDGTTDLWTAQRASVNSAWSAPTKVTDFGIADNEEDPWTSTDRRMFTFAKATVAAPALKQLYLSVR
jgi:Tol biopolymer transport system component